MPIVQLLLSYVLLLLGSLAAVAVYTEFRQRRFKSTESSDRIFRCARCGYVYTDDPDVDRSRCSQCGQMNEPIQF
jgi:predicted Zn-ribbon and HTH transcriptional regulator